jgi:hypothetical protein
VVAKSLMFISEAVDSTGQIGSNDSNDSIFSFNTDDSYYLDDDGEIERLSEFEAVSCT